MRSLIEMRTRNQADVDIPRSEFEMAMPYYKYVKGLSQRPFGYDISREQKMRMGIDFEDEDENFEDPDYSYHLLLNKVLDEMAEEESSEYQFSQDMSLELSSENFSENSDKIEENYRR